jgi:uncharacterized protein (DUF1697 family)
MPRLIAFLRAVNVGGRNVTMEQLRAHFSALGFTDVNTFIASGNVLFTSRAEKPAEPPEASAVERLKAFKTDIDEFHLHGRELFWRCKTRQSDSTMSNAVFERLLNVRLTFRGINTISRLSVKFCGVVPVRENMGHSSPKGGVAPLSTRGPKSKRDR